MSQPSLAYAGEVLKIVKITNSSYTFWNICPVVYIVSSDHWEMLGLYNGQRIFFTLICDLVLGLFFLSRPGIFIQSSSDLHGLMPVLNKKKNNDL